MKTTFDSKEFKELQVSFVNLANAVNSNISIDISALTEDLSERLNGITSDILVAFSKIELPRVQFISQELMDKIPKANKRAMQNFKEIVEHNSSSGWLFTGSIGSREYLNASLLDYSGQELDEYFYNYYNHYDGYNYKLCKQEVLGGIDEKFSGLIEEVFSSFEKGDYKITIPSLLSIIEGEVANLSDGIDKKLVNNKLFTNAEKHLEEIINIQDGAIEFDLIILTNLFRYLKIVFSYKDFEKNRPSTLNRSWALHGRDNPELWTKTDYFRLLNNLSSICFLKKDIINEV